MINSEIYKARHRNLRRLMSELGGQKALVEASGKGQAQISQLTKTENYKRMGEKLAREIETQCGKPHGWLDQGGIADQDVSGQERMVLRDFTDIGFTVVAEPCDVAPDHVYEFKAYQIIGESEGKPVYNKLGHSSSPDPVHSVDEAEVFLTGSVKWDGCSNWDFPELKDCMMHFCGPEEGTHLGVLFERIYGMAQELIPNADFC